MSRSHILISWLAKREDPYLTDHRGNPISGDDGRPILGPIHGVAIDDASPFAGQIDRAVILVMKPKRSDRLPEETRQRFKNLRAIIDESSTPFDVELKEHHADNPTDHAALYEYCLSILGAVRREYPTSRFVINTSSGTPAMHTVWVLLSETGQIDGEYVLVQGVPPQVRSATRPESCVEVQIGIESAFKRYRGIKLATPSGPPEVGIDPSRAKSDVLRRLYEEIQLYSPANMPLLIMGERGSGKTEIAKFVRSIYLDARSLKGSPDWPTVNCGQFRGDPSAMRSELFGHRKGAFTGAVSNRDGILKEVNRDVLFLDEIGDLDRSSQRLLIRSIEEKRYTPLGSDRPIESDFRIVSATNRSDADLASSSGLDADFFDRISVLRVFVPPLREVPEDLDWIWDKVLAETARRSGVQRVDLSDVEQMVIVSRIRGENLPGNYRDLIRLASHVLLFLSAPTFVDNRSTALERAMNITFNTPAGNDSDIYTQVALRFANGESASDVLQNSSIDVKHAVNRYKYYLGEQCCGLFPKNQIKERTGASYEALNKWRRPD